jgi:hypothetical protein
MKINFESSYKKKYIELLPTLAVSWYSRPVIYLGFLFWSLVIKLSPTPLADFNGKK